MTRRLTADREGPGVVLSLRLTAELAAGLEQVRAELAATAADLAASSPGLLAAGMLRAPSPSDAARVLLTEALAARVSRDTAPATPMRPKPAPDLMCPTCGMGVAHACVRCGARTRTCGCNVATEGRCESCDLAPRETSPVVVDAITTPKRPEAPTVRAKLLALQATDDSSHWTTRAVAERAGVGKNTVSKIMRGEPVLPKGLSRVAAVLTPRAVAERAILTTAVLPPAK